MTEARMQEVPEYKPGTFCWVELGTSDSGAAKSFYSQLFGWEYEDNPMGPDMVYTMLKLNGKEIGGLYNLMPDMVAQGIPPNWLSYISVTNADEACEKIKAAGGTVINGPFDVASHGRMAMVKDPADAVFAIWQAKEHKGSEIYNVPNSFCWNELATPDTAKAGDFYTGLFGWGKNVREMSPGFSYTSFTNGDRQAGGMYKPTPEMGEIPANWLTYFAVSDTDATAKKATELGAKAIVPPADIPEVGRFAVIQDPQGAVFGIIKLNPRS